MSKTKGPFAEDRFLLSDENGSGELGGIPRGYPRPAIVRGVANRLEKWPSHLFVGFLAACFIVTGLALLIFLAAVLYLPATSIDDFRLSRNIGSLRNAIGYNIYFIKHENSTWSAEDFCRIDAAARENRDANIYLINLLDNPKSESEETGSLEKSKEVFLKQQLTSRNPNVRNVDVEVERFFYGSKLSGATEKLKPDALMAAAKAYLLWNSPGVVLEPNISCNAKMFRNFLHQSREIGIANALLIDLEHGVQTTGVPCQAFIAFLIDDLLNLSKNEVSDQEYRLEETVNKFCLRSLECPEIKVFKSEQCPIDTRECSLNYPNALPINLEDFMTNMEIDIAWP